MPWIKDSLNRIFSSKSPSSTEHDDPAHMMLTRNELEALAAPKAHPYDDLFVHAGSFLNAVQKAAEGSPLDHLLGMTPESVRIATRISLLNAIEAGKCPFFHRQIDSDTNIHVSNMYVPVAYLAKRAMSLMDNTRSVTLPAIYVDALKDAASNDRVRNRYNLSNSLHWTYEEGSNFELGTAKRGPNPLETVLQPRSKNGPQPD